MRLLLSLTIFILISEDCFSEPQTEFKIGVIAPLSGTLAHLGTTVKNAAIIAEGDFDKDNTSSLIIEDDGFVPKNTVAATQKLIDIDKINALIVFGSSTSIAASEIAEKRKIPMIGLGIADKITQGKRYVFRYFLEPKVQTELIAEQVMKNGYTRIGIIYTEQDGMIALKDLFRASMPSVILMSEGVIPGETDLRSVAAKAKEADLQAIFVALLPPQISIFAKQMRDLKYKGDFFGGAQLQQRDELQAALGALDGTWFATFDDRAATDLYQRYEARFHLHPHPDGIAAYDAIHLLLKAKSQDIPQYLKEVSDFSGLFGQVKVIENNTFRLPGLIKIVRGTEFKVYN